ncbi:MAG: alanine:cation symporter family protein [Coriobacteriales bacterium]|nr:alanine:cation symporter family protein [Coriobacteriales bacterium]
MRHREKACQRRAQRERIPGSYDVYGKPRWHRQHRGCLDSNRAWRPRSHYVGTGNIAGVSTAIALGGPGAIIWMWIMCIVGGATAFVESTLAQIWKVRGKDGEFFGGPAYYIEQALGKRWLGIVFAVSIILCFALGFNGLQSYNMSSSVAYYFDSTTYALGNESYFATQVPMVLGIIFALFMAFVIFGGAQRISFMTAFIVPVMAITYIIFALVVFVLHIGDLPQAFAMMFSELFRFGAVDDGVSGIQAFFGGLAGSAIMLGIKRGLYSNEAGMGSAPNAAATASVSHPAKQGLVQTLSVYIDTILICTCSAIIVLSFYVEAGGTAGFNGMFLVQKAVESTAGVFGVYFLTFAIFAFGLSSLIANYFYAENNLKFITTNKNVLLVFRIVCLIPAFIGAQMDISLAWNLADIFMGFQAIVNIVAILLLGKWAFKVLDDYSEQRKRGLDPVFVANTIPGLPATQCWHVSEQDLVDGLISEDQLKRTAS